MMTILETIKLATEFLEKHKIENSRLNAELMLSHILNCKRFELYKNFDQPLTESEINLFRKFLRERVSGKPLQYITGKAYFYGLEFIVTPDVLIPRPETELLVEEILNSIDKNISYKILDIGSGSGNIGIVLAKYLGRSIVYCIDVSEKALKIAMQNAQTHNLTNIFFEQIDIFNQIPSHKDFDIIVSNPPYISEMKRDSLQREVRLHEPSIALFVDQELKFYQRISELSREILKTNGKLFFEIDDHLADGVSKILLNNGFKDLKVLKDYSNLNRIIYGVKTE